MADKQKFEWSKAKRIADEIVAMMTPHVERIEIAGSLRRKKPLVSDIEILFIPKMYEAQSGLFETVSVSATDQYLAHLLTQDVIRQRPSINGSSTWGTQNKLGIHVASGIPVDFFSTDAARWWNSLVMRTGSKDTNLALTNGALRRGGHWKVYSTGFEDSDGRMHPAKSEEDVFNLCGIQYLPPEHR